MIKRNVVFPVLVLMLTWSLTACGEAGSKVLTLGTTTSTYDSGLLDTILPDFEARYNAEVDVIAVGTGQALALGEAGDVDVILVHARVREEAFVAQGHGTERFDVMYNDFVLVGPPADPAGVQGFEFARDAFVDIAAAEAPFASRGDDSGTHTKEMAVWSAAGIEPAGEWYASLGQGMGETLLYAQETGSYTLSDRGTFLALKENLADLVVIVGGSTIAENADPALRNPYSVIPVNPDKGGIAYDLAQDFVGWLTSVDVQQKISEFGMATYAQPLFYPDSAEWRARP